MRLLQICAVVILGMFSSCTTTKVDAEMRRIEEEAGIFPSCTTTKSAAEMWRIQEEKGVVLGWGGLRYKETIYYAGSSARYHYVGERRPLLDGWRIYRVPRADLELEPGMETVYNDAALHDDTTMRYAVISAGPPYVLRKQTRSRALPDIYLETATGEKREWRKASKQTDRNSATHVQSPPQDLPIPPLPEARDR